MKAIITLEVPLKNVSDIEEMAGTLEAKILDIVFEKGIVSTPPVARSRARKQGPRTFNNSNYRLGSKKAMSSLKPGTNQECVVLYVKKTWRAGTDQITYDDLRSKLVHALMATKRVKPGRNASHIATAMISNLVDKKVLVKI